MGNEEWEPDRIKLMLNSLQHKADTTYLIKIIMLISNPG